ncbi:TetR/AcrR family transcriptional regulator [Pseudonocardia kunmingensis]|uniref:TetR family transcriptional regulator n=1 Tax=Pseudonocardia kunmingensis TaxID=630975 RepID=A0A543DYM3_9PSEU|nr:TetR/AcrR family transcriptional regulator [Pseudonocardia kunmingensis]TQM14430.1 TetR family transcriptional regulator [Pseudonocardia kunmingensis]
MPRQVDHDLRRRQIAEAVWRLATRGGLEDVTLRQVAAEADVSARLLQYYFGTRDQLLLGALEILNTDAEQRARQRLAALGAAPGTRAIVRGVLLEMLPLDEERRNRHLTYVAYFVRFLADPNLGAVVRDAPLALEELVADLLRRGQNLGEVRADVDARAEASFLVAGADGLQSGVLLGQRAPEQAVALIDHQLARIFPGTTDEPEPAAGGLRPPAAP